MGSIAYLSNTARHDLSYAAHMLSKFLNNPGEAHWTAAKHVYVGLTHLRETILEKALCLIGHSDADFASDQDDHVSISGYSFSVGDNAVVSWAAKKQNCVTLSTNEAEMHAFSEALKEAD